MTSYPFIEEDYDDEKDFEPHVAVVNTTKHGNVASKGSTSTENDNTAAENRTSATTASDLQNLLAELAKYSEPCQEDQQQQRPNHVEQVPKDSLKLQQLQQLPIPNTQQAHLIYPTPNSQGTYFHNIINPLSNSQHHQNITPAAQLSRTPPINPATILEWPQALRCINKISAQNPSFAAFVKGVSC
jgi:hypothetical protein